MDEDPAALRRGPRRLARSALAVLTTEAGARYRPPRRLVRSVLAVLATACAVVFGAFAEPASAASALSLNPTTIRPGFSVTIHATCGENVNPAFVHSGAFGSVTLVPSNGLLRTDVTVPPDTIPGVYTVFLECASGQSDSTQLTVVHGGQQPNPDVGPQTGGGEMSASAAMRTFYGGLAAATVGGVIWILAGLLLRRRSRR